MEKDPIWQQLLGVGLHRGWRMVLSRLHAKDVIRKLSLLSIMRMQLQEACPLFDRKKTVCLRNHLLSLSIPSCFQKSGCIIQKNQFLSKLLAFGFENSSWYRHHEKRVSSLFLNSS